MGDKNPNKPDRLKKGPDEKTFPKTIRKKQERKLNARKTADRGLWFGLGMFGLVGWSVAIPTVAGAFIGIWMDRIWTGKPSWTLTMLIAGVFVGCLNAWYWVKRESRKEE
jgi:ATP synthase protein I